jgi:hypothetical protein
MCNMCKMFDMYYCIYEGFAKNYNTALMTSKRNQELHVKYNDTNKEIVISRTSHILDQDKKGMF